MTLYQKIIFFISIKLGLFVTLKKEYNFSISKNFNIREFFSKDSKCESHVLNSKFFSILQHMRNQFGITVITSSYRSKEYNSTILGAIDDSEHIRGNALDISINDFGKFLEFVTEIRMKKQMYSFLRKRGITGIGIYDNFVHLDFRKKFSTKYKDKFGRVDIWEGDFSVMPQMPQI